MISKKPIPPTGILGLYFGFTKVATRPIHSFFSFINNHLLHFPILNNLLIEESKTASISLSNGCIHLGSFLYIFNGNSKDCLMALSVLTSLTFISQHSVHSLQYEEFIYVKKFIQVFFS